MLRKQMIGFVRIGRAVAVVSAFVLSASLALPASSAGAAPARKPGPLRVLLVGDSLTGNYGAVAAPRLRAKGYQVTVASIGGSGLLDSDKCHGRYAKQLRKTVQPDVVVYQNKGNYSLLTKYGVPPCRPVLGYGTPAFYRRWEQAARQSQKILSKNGARFIWVLNPTVAVNIDPGRQIVPHLNRIYASLAPSGGSVDAWTAFGGETYDPTLHQMDGLHLNAAGSELMASLVVAAIG